MGYTHRAARGLFHGRIVGFGNKVSESGRRYVPTSPSGRVCLPYGARPVSPHLLLVVSRGAMLGPWGGSGAPENRRLGNVCAPPSLFLSLSCRTRRNWRPNVHSKRLWSDALGKWVHFNVTTKALRCVDKAGGLDNYVKNLHGVDIAGHIMYSKPAVEHLHAVAKALAAGSKGLPAAPAASASSTPPPAAASPPPSSAAAPAPVPPAKHRRHPVFSWVAKGRAKAAAAAAAAVDPSLSKKASASAIKA